MRRVARLKCAIAAGQEGRCGRNAAVEIADNTLRQSRALRILWRETTDGDESGKLCLLALLSQVVAGARVRAISRDRRHRFSPLPWMVQSPKKSRAAQFARRVRPRHMRALCTYACARVRECRVRRRPAAKIDVTGRSTDDLGPVPRGRSVAPQPLLSVDSPRSFSAKCAC